MWARPYPCLAPFADPRSVSQAYLLMSAPLLSLVVATVGRTAEVARLLDSLLAQTGGSFEVLIVDQNPDDRLAEIVIRASDSGLVVKHLRMSVPNLSLARNAGLSASRGEFIAFPDDDCWYEPSAVMHVLQAFNSDPTAQGIVACWHEQSFAAGRLPTRQPLSLVAGRQVRDGDARSISLFFRRSLFDRLGGFDQRFGVGQWFGAGEETDFVLRALSAGALIGREPFAVVHHHYDKTPIQDWRRGWLLARRRARGTGGLYAKHKLGAYVVLRGWLAPLVLTLWRNPTLPALAASAGTCLGRLEGFFRYRSDRNPSPTARGVDP